MKKMKKMMALAIAVVMMMAMSMTTMAEGPEYKITITNPVVGQTYSAYKLFDVTRTDDGDSDLTDENYSYTVTGEWYEILKDTDYFDFTQIGNTGVYNVKEKNNFDAANFAKYLNKLSEKPEPVANSGVVAQGAGSATIALGSTKAGYYFVDSSLGALCSLGTVAKVATISEKNAKPQIEKFVQEDSKTEDKSWGKTATADIGEKVKFQLKVNVGSGNPTTGIDKNYVITDTLPTGLSVATTDVGVSYGDDIWGTSNYTVTISEQKLVITLLADEGKKLASVPNNADIVIEYLATVGKDVTVNDNATVDLEGNVNTAVLQYGTYGNGVAGTTTSSSATVYTFQIDVLKYYNNKENKLAGAKFILSKNVEGTERLVLDGEYPNYTYTNTTTTTGTEIVTNKTQTFNVKGLDAGTYYLVETEAPEGYNKLTAPIKVVISEEGVITYGDSNTNIDNTDEQIQVENKTGSLLPETGGIGTTIFYTAGALLVIAGVVVLVTRKRMENQ